MAGTHGRRGTPALVGDAQAEAEALNLKLAGLPYREIAKQQNCSVSTAHDRVQRALASIVPADKVDELRKVENERLNAAVLACVQIIAGQQTIHIDGRDVVMPYSADERLAAVGRLTKISERLSKLNGLDIPVVQKIEAEVTHLDLTDAELRRLAQELAAGGAPATAGVPREGPEES
jgi:DNA-binding Lrp family transcriptional regulator